MSQNYTQEVKVLTSPNNAFEALTRHVKKWWGNTDKPVSKVGDEFTIHFGNAFWKFKVIKYVLNSEIVWKCIDGQPGFENEWVGTSTTWNITPTADGVLVSFMHDGLTPDFNCYDICAPTWDMFITKSLKHYLETGKGMPHN